MSSHERRIVVSPRARRDLIDILRYTEERWGRRQLDTYRDKIDAALNLVANNPDLGHTDSDLPDTHRVYFIGSHVIVYRTTDLTIGIVRVLHQRMHLGRQV